MGAADGTQKNSVYKGRSSFVTDHSAMDACVVIKEDENSDLVSHIR